MGLSIKRGGPPNWEKVGEKSERSQGRRQEKDLQKAAAAGKKNIAIEGKIRRC